MPTGDGRMGQNAAASPVPQLTENCRYYRKDGGNGGRVWFYTTTPGLGNTVKLYRNAGVAILGAVVGCTLSTPTPPLPATRQPGRSPQNKETMLQQSEECHRSSQTSALRASLRQTQAGVTTNTRNAISYHRLRHSASVCARPRQV